MWALLLAATFQGLGDLPGGAVHSEALVVSGDGKVVAGRSASESSPEEGFVWTEQGGLRPLLGEGGEHVGGEPRAIDAKGKVVGGKISKGGLESARWTAPKGWSLLGDLEGGGKDSQVLGMSADGSVLAGWGSSAQGLQAARWVAGRAVAIGDLPGGPVHSAAAAVSADGKTIAGTGTTEQGQVAFLWTDKGLVPLGELDGGDYGSEPFGISPNGTVVVGKSSSKEGIEAFRWTRDGMNGMGDLPGGDYQSMAFDVCDCGTIVGMATIERGPVAFLWSAEKGMRSIEEMLVGVGSAKGWQLTEANSISDDGRTIVGNGINPDGKPEGWVVRLP